MFRIVDKEKAKANIQRIKQGDDPTPLVEEIHYAYPLQLYYLVKDGLVLGKHLGDLRFYYNTQCSL